MRDPLRHAVSLAALVTAAAVRAQVGPIQIEHDIAFQTMTSDQPCHGVPDAVL